MPAGRLIDELWGEAPPSSAANMLQGYVSRLRKTLEPGRDRGEHELLVSHPRGYVLRIRPEQLDSERFVRLTAEARRLLEEGDARAAAARFDQALALWRGPALADLAHEPFARPDVERLEELRLGAVEDRIDAELAAGADGALVGELRELVAEHPLRERLRGQLMIALYRGGRQADALAVYRDGRQALKDELGIEPGPALRELERGILRHDPGLGAARPPPRVAAARPRRGPLVGLALLAVAGAVAAAATIGRSGGGAVAVRPHSVAVIDPARNAVVDDVAVGGYPGPVTADGKHVYVGNIGDATVSTIAPASRTVDGTSSLSRAIDLAAVDGHLWAADGGVAGHTPAPPGTVLDVDLDTARMRVIRLGPSVDGDEEQTTLAASPDGTQVWAGNKDSATVTRVEPPAEAAVHGVAPGGLAVVGGTVWASDPSRNAVVRIDAGTARIAHRIAVAGEPTRVAADEHAVWVVARDRGGTAGRRPTAATRPTLVRIDPRTNRVAARIPLPLTPLRVALGGGSVWVTAMRVLDPAGASTDATVLRIDPRTNRIVARIPLRTRAVDGIAVANGLVWVAVPESQ